MQVIAQQRVPWPTASRVNVQIVGSGGGGGGGYGLPGAGVPVALQYQLVNLQNMADKLVL